MEKRSKQQCTGDKIIATNFVANTFYGGKLPPNHTITTIDDPMLNFQIQPNKRGVGRVHHLVLVVNGVCTYRRRVIDEQVKGSDLVLSNGCPVYRVY